jgi:hypothetical protein
MVRVSADAADDAAAAAEVATGTIKYIAILELDD